jgi:hypothetical protein
MALVSHSVGSSTLGGETGRMRRQDDRQDFNHCAYGYISAKKFIGYNLLKGVNIREYAPSTKTKKLADVSCGKNKIRGIKCERKGKKEGR